MNASLAVEGRNKNTLQGKRTNSPFSQLRMGIGTWSSQLLYDFRLYNEEMTDGNFVYRGTIFISRAYIVSSFAGDFRWLLLVCLGIKMRGMLVEKEDEKTRNKMVGFWETFESY